MSDPKRRRGRPVRSGQVWIEPEMNEELDARKLGRAFLALAMHRARLEAEAKVDHDVAGGAIEGDCDAGA
jgi:hypothetical protein